MRCPRTEQHEPHWHVVRAGTVVVAQGECWGLPIPAPVADPSGDPNGDNQ